MAFWEVFILQKTRTLIFAGSAWKIQSLLIPAKLRLYLDNLLSTAYPVELRTRVPLV